MISVPLWKPKIKFTYHYVVREVFGELLNEVDEVVVVRDETSNMVELAVLFGDGVLDELRGLLSLVDGEERGQ